MYFAATPDTAIDGYTVYIVGFETRKLRNEFVKNSNTYFEAITVKEAAKHENYKLSRKYPKLIFNNRTLLDLGEVIFTRNGNFSHVRY